MKEEYVKHWQKDNPTEKGYYYFADWLVTQLRGIKKLINTRDRDYVIIIDGQEGSAKSTVAAQVAYHVDKSWRSTLLFTGLGAYFIVILVKVVSVDSSWCIMIRS